MIDPLEALYRALGAKVGVVINTDNPRLFRDKLYEARRKADDPDLHGLSIVVSPRNPNELWILKNGKEAGAGEGDA